ncbi:MAG: 4-aminobutyrate aminotransferase / (S)-3-amino-2-methylpropionate transaminase / 5-aminovalerate [Gaiellaceae bacterium]|nr:4-aminobutyrate aminotransferase / (S)-3-amino-2-methylpropionate transaminase / 5-aminovalerate [Gaiellaceae bacterium]
MATTRTIDIRTAIPGPRSAAILERKRRVIANAKTIVLPIVAQEGRGATLTDVDGNVFVDFTGGVGCLNTGHAHPRVVEAATEQLARFAHTDFTVVPYEPYIELAERLLERAPFRVPAKAAFFNAGTEAVENAVKFARLATKRPAVIAFEGAFHGRTLLSMTLTSRPHPYKVGMGPLAPEVYRAPFPQDYRGPDTETALHELRQMFLTEVAAEQVAAIIVEPVQGEGGFLPAPQAFLEGLRAICDEHGICLIVDEVQTGFARTGKLFAIEHYGIEPDLITVAKSIAAGLPLSGVLGKAQIMDAAHDGAIGGTFVGNPVAQAAALAVLDVIEEEGLCDRATAIGETIRARMLGWQERFPAIGDVRGLGAMLAIELVADRATKQPAGELTQSVLDAALQRGLLLLKAGVHGNAIRVLTPLVITDAELDEALAAWEDALESVLS